jgi:hypothetical protein
MTVRYDAWGWLRERYASLGKVVEARRRYLLREAPPLNLLSMRCIFTMVSVKRVL